MAQREQAEALGQFRRGAVRLGEHAQRAQLLLGELADVRAADPAPEVLGDDRRDLLGVAAAVAARRHLVQQRRELDHLAVAAAGQQGRLAEPGVLVLAEQLYAVGEDEDVTGAGRRRGRRRGAHDGHVALRSALVGVLRELRVDLVRLFRGVRARHELGVQHLPDAGLLGLDGQVELIDRRVLRLERLQRVAHVRELAATRNR